MKRINSEHFFDFVSVLAEPAWQLLEEAVCVWRNAMCANVLWRDAPFAMENIARELSSSDESAWSVQREQLVCLIDRRSCAR